MKKAFSAKWKSSKQPRKQRKYRAKAPLHIRKKFVRIHLSKELRKKYKKRAFGVRKGDKVKVLRGSFKGKEGKIVGVNLKRSVVFIEGIQRTRRDGSKVNVPFQPSNLLLLELNLEDRKRLAALQKNVS